LRYPSRFPYGSKKYLIDRVDRLLESHGDVQSFTYVHVGVLGCAGF
jgi:hypothetical protein